MCTKNSCTCSKGNNCPVAYPTYPGSLAGPQGIQGIQGVGYVLTSSTPLVFPMVLGSQALTVNLTALSSAYTVGARIRASDPANPTVDYFEGIVTAYSAFTMTVDIDYAPGTSVAPIVLWDINITGDTGASLGFDDVPWVEVAATNADISEVGTGASGLTNMNGVFRYKNLGKTMIFNYYLQFDQLVSDAAGTYSCTYQIVIPGGFIQNSAYDVGFSIAAITDSNGTGDNVTSVTLTPTPGFVTAGNFVKAHNIDPATLFPVDLFGCITFETT